jgi:hypothetical protein
VHKAAILEKRGRLREKKNGRVVLEELARLEAERGVARQFDRRSTATRKQKLRTRRSEHARFGEKMRSGGRRVLPEF